MRKKNSGKNKTSRQFNFKNHWFSLEVYALKISNANTETHNVVDLDMH